MYNLAGGEISLGKLRLVVLLVEDEKGTSRKVKFPQL